MITKSERVIICSLGKSNPLIHQLSLGINGKRVAKIKNILTPKRIGSNDRKVGLPFITCSYLGSKYASNLFLWQKICVLLIIYDLTKIVDSFLIPKKS